MKIKFYSLIVLVLAIISLSGCVSRKQVQFYQGIDNLAESQIYDNDKIRIKPDDRLVIRIFSTNQEAATPFNPMIISRSGGGGGEVVVVVDGGRDGTLELARGLAIMEEGESLGDTLARLQAQSPAQRRERAEQARHAALTMNRRAIDTWLQVLGHCARQAPLLPKRWPSPI